MMNTLVLSEDNHQNLTCLKMKLICALWLRWKGVFWDVLVWCVMVAFGVNVVQRVRHVVQHNCKHLWQVLYHRTAILLDTAILVLQAFSKLVGTKTSLQPDGLPVPEA